MKNILSAKIKSLNLNKEKFLKKPIKAIKKIRIHKLKSITNFSLNKTFENFKEKIKQAEKTRTKIFKQEKIKEAKKEKLEQKKQKIIDLKEIKKAQLTKIKEEKQRLINHRKTKN